MNLFLIYAHGHHYNILVECNYKNDRVKYFYHFQYGESDYIR